MSLICSDFVNKILNHEWGEQIFKRWKIVLTKSESNFLWMKLLNIVKIGSQNVNVIGTMQLYPSQFFNWF